jgi:hypothetical protein
MLFHMLIGAQQLCSPTTWITPHVSINLHNSCTSLFSFHILCRKIFGLVKPSKWCHKARIKSPNEKRVQWNCLLYSCMSWGPNSLSHSRDSPSHARGSSPSHPFEKAMRFEYFTILPLEITQSQRHRIFWRGILSQSESVKAWPHDERYGKRLCL